MKWLLMFGLLASLDNVQAASGIGMLPVSAWRKLKLTLAFTICETLMLMVGLWIGDRFVALPLWQAYAEQGKALLLFLCGVAVMLSTQNKPDMEALLQRPAISFGIPLALGSDNLFAGIGLGAMVAPNLLMLLAYGLMVLLLCLFGLLLGAKLKCWLQARAPDQADWISGAYLMVLAGISLLSY